MNSHLMQSLCQWITGRTNFGSQNSTDFGVRNTKQPKGRMNALTYRFDIE